MAQSYTLLTIGTIPFTRLLSYQEFCKTQKPHIKTFILQLLLNYPAGLSSRDIAQISGIERQSLTAPLKELEISGKLLTTNIKRQEKTKRLVQLYTLNSSADV